MIADLKPYPAMKDSGVEWLGEVPEHWEVRQLGRIGRFSKGSGGTKEDEVADGVPCVRYGDLYTRHRFFVRDSKACITEEKAADYTPILHGDVLFAGSGETIEEIGISAVNLISGPAYCGGDVIIFRPSVEVDANFFGYATDCPQAAYQKSCMGRGITVMHIYGDELKYMYVGLPPLPEQAAIVRYLDHVDRRVRRLVRAKQKLIGLLEEQKQAIIHRAVTRGLDSDVPLKDSGVEWLGEVPAHWEVVRLKFVAEKIVDCLHATPLYSDAGAFPAIRTADIAPGVVRLKQARLIEAHEYEKWIQRLRPAEGDILYSREGERFGIAACVPDGVNLCISQRMMVFRLRKDHNSSFVMWLLNSPQVFAQASQDVMGATVPHVNVSTIRNYALALPSHSEQDAIIEHITRSTGTFAQAIDRARREVELLREYRTRLIADVVTGKLDVREVAARLPDEADESELLDDADDLVDEVTVEADALPEEDGG
jgi:type I restriction enzyme, S subunit